jgi:RimJ/RimL family protein N-acetyltransferase
MEIEMIYGKRIRFRGIERDDLPMFVRWFNDPEVRENLLMHLPMSLAEEEKWFENVLTRPAAERPMVIETQIDGEWTAIGNIGIHNIDARIRKAEVGISIGEKQYWNHGYGTEAMQLLLKHGFNTLNLNRISLDVYETNPRAIRAYQKAGFKEEGRLREGHYFNGKYIDIIVMSVLRSEWQDQ